MLIRRFILASTIAASLALATAGCNMMSPVASQDYYAPSDGSQADLGRLKVRNLIYFVNKDGGYGFFGAFANSGPDEIAFAIQYTDSDGKTNYREFSVAGYQVKNFGYQGTQPLKIQLPGNLGDMTSVLVYTETDQIDINLPVLDGTLPEYADLVAKLGTN